MNYLDTMRGHVGRVKSAGRRPPMPCNNAVAPFVVAATFRANDSS